MNWFIYILECSDKSLYTGITTDLDRRLTEHNSMKGGAKYTKPRQPVKILRSQAVENRKLASQGEHFIKKMTKSEKNKLIDNKRDSELVKKLRNKKSLVIKATPFPEPVEGKDSHGE